MMIHSLPKCAVVRAGWDGQLATLDYLLSCVFALLSSMSLVSFYVDCMICISVDPEIYTRLMPSSFLHPGLSCITT